jgi:hypothetical protein
MEKKVLVVVHGSCGNVGKKTVKVIITPNLYSNVTLIHRRLLPKLDALDPSIKVIVCDLYKIEEVNLSGYTTGIMTLGADNPQQLSKDELYGVDTVIPFRKYIIVKDE